MSLRFFKEPVRLEVEVLILLEVEMISFFPIIFKLLFRGAGFGHCLRKFSRFFFICKKIKEPVAIAGSQSSGNPF